MIIGPQTDIVNGGGRGILEIFEKSTISRLISYSILIAYNWLLVVVVDLPQVSLEWVLIGYIQFIMRSVFKTDLIINWIYPIKTHSRETWGKSMVVVVGVTFFLEFM
jgi:hypothetical protein